MKTIFLIKGTRVAQKHPCKALAPKLGITVGAYRDIELGTRPVSRKELRLLSAELKKSMDYLRGAIVQAETWRELEKKYLEQAREFARLRSTLRRANKGQ